MKFLSFFTFLLFVSIMPFQIVAKPNILDTQVMLMQLGFDPGKPDGLWGKNTSNALVEFFESKGKKFDGKLDENAINLIKAELKEKSFKIGENTNLTLDIRTLILIICFVVSMVSMYAKLQADNFYDTEVNKITGGMPLPFDMKSFL